MEVIASSVNDAAKSLGVHRATVYRLIDQGKLRKVKLGRKTLIPADSLRALLSAA